MISSMPACGIVGLPEKVYCLELIFNSCSQKYCVQCPIVNPSKRRMKIDRALASVSEAAAHAQEAGFKKISLSLIGGDSLEDWERFVEFCEGIWKCQNDLKLPIQITALTCGNCLDEKKENYLLDNSYRLRLNFRWNGEAGTQMWNNSSVLRYHPMTYKVDYCLSKNGMANFLHDIREIADVNKKLTIEFLDLDKWNMQDFSAYFECLKLFKPKQGRKNVLSIRDSYEPCGRRIHTIDIDGRRYPCRYFSPERMTYSALQDIQHEYDQKSQCPVLGRFLRTTAYRNLDKVWA